MEPHKRTITTAALAALFTLPAQAGLQMDICPSREEVSSPFSMTDRIRFERPDRIYYPETWFHYVNGNVDKEGISKDLEAIASAGISGIQLFHGGNASGTWPAVTDPVMCLGPKWDDLVAHTAGETSRLGLRFTMQNCPGWSMAGGPWIKPSDAMRHLVNTRVDIDGGAHVSRSLSVPVSEEESSWRDYRDIMVIAFPTPEGDTGTQATPDKVESDTFADDWAVLLSGGKATINLESVEESGKPHQITATYNSPRTIRSIVFSNVEGFSHGWCYDPGVRVTVEAVASDGSTRNILDADMPMSSWQDNAGITFALDQACCGRFIISIYNKHQMRITALKLLEAARKNNWESEAGWTLRSITYGSEHPEQSPEAFIRKSTILDISRCMSEDGTLEWDAPEGRWTVLRIGNVNTGMKNAPAPAEATGWECDKLSASAADLHFSNYIKRVNDGPAHGILNSMLLDSWECRTQTWTPLMEQEFAAWNGYSLREWIPAVFGYVIEDHETTARFLYDWRACINHLFTENFYGRMSRNAKANGLNIQYETAAGDIFPGDILEYYKYADVPMCEFWNAPKSDSYVGSINFKPVKMTASAAHVYGKTRVSAESLTSFDLTWDEHLSRLKDVANQNYWRGVTHSVFHTYTHNPAADSLVPGTSFGNKIGTPFLRGQTWWKHMPEFTTYFARLSYMLERGVHSADVLWYLGDCSMHKPDENHPFPDGYKYDYCNLDVLLHRVDVDKDGCLVMPEGQKYKLLWIPDNHHMLPATAARLRELVAKGATLVSDAPLSVGTLVDCEQAAGSFGFPSSSFAGNAEAIWGDAASQNKRVLAGYTIDSALHTLGIAPDLLVSDATDDKPSPGWVHRRTDGADWYFIASPLDGEFRGTVDINCTGEVSLWDPVSGSISAINSTCSGGRTRINLELPYAGSCFVVFDHTARPSYRQPVRRSRTSLVSAMDTAWKLSFPDGWGAPAEVLLDTLDAWKNLNIGDEGRAFSGTASYTRKLTIRHIDSKAVYVLDLGKVDGIAKLYVNGAEIRTLWCPPYKAEITSALKRGDNDIRIELTSTWYNRLVYDASRPENERKTWVLYGPSSGSPYRDSGLLGPVNLYKQK